MVMAVFNEIIEFIACNCNFSYSTKATQGIEKCVSEYLDGMKNSGGLNNVTDCTFRLIFHGARELNKADQEFLKASETKNASYPIIHLTTFDIFEHDIPKLPTKRYSKIVDSSIWNYYVPLEVMVKDSKGEVKKDQDGKPLWQYDNNYDLFIKVLEDISRNKKNHLYDLAITHEHADLNARLLEQSRLEGSHKNISPFLFHSEEDMKEFIKSYEVEKPNEVSLNTIRNHRWRFLLLDDKSIEKMSSQVSQGQHVDVCKLKIIANNLHHVLDIDENKIWFRVFEFEPAIRKKNGNRVLDDNEIAIEPEENGKPVELKFRCGRVVNGSFQMPKGLNKELFMPKSDPEIPAALNDIQIVIDCVKYVDAAQYCLQKFKYDIILLDYLLDKDKVYGEQEYGYQLLEKLNDWFKEKKKKEKDEVFDEKDPIYTLYVPGPNKRFFFMFTSAFTTAVHERLLAEGFAKSERGLWYIGEGACPTNTPYLFSYLLMLLMRHRVKDLRKENEGSLFSVIDLLWEIYVKKDEAGMEETRQKAHKHFNHVLFMRDKYKTLEIDFSKDDESHLKQHTNDANYILNMESSLLVQSVFKIVNHFSGAFFEHLQHLVYLTAFGTIRQWQDMWEEYMFVSKELCDYDILFNEKVKDEKGKVILVRRGKAVSDAIREYIINLKENNY